MTLRPDVSAEVTVDFDHHSDEFNLNELAINAELRRRCPVAWNEKYGGFWFVSGYDAVNRWPATATPSRTSTSPMPPTA